MKITIAVVCLWTSQKRLISLIISFLLKKTCDVRARQKFFKNYDRIHDMLKTKHSSKRLLFTASSSHIRYRPFILYVNDKFRSLDQDALIYMYGDGTVLVCKDNYINMVSEKAEKHFQNMSTWCEAKSTSQRLNTWLLDTLKPSKNQLLKPKITKKNTVHHYKYLGFLLDDKLSMNDYLDVVWEKNLKKGYSVKNMMLNFGKNCY